MVNIRGIKVRFILYAMTLMSLRADFIPLGQPVPRRGKPPVLFVTGHDAVCPSAASGELPYFNLTFGSFDKVLEQQGRIALDYDVCNAPGRPPIEEIANHMGRLLEALRYEDGTPVREMDVITHSMGGLVVRSYLAGKQTAAGVFRPPEFIPFRKLVFIGTPHFGTPVAAAFAADPQLREMSLGSRFLFDLNTWNQGIDDLRGLDALALAGTAGITSADQFNDGVVSVTSASVDFAGAPTRLLPLCHTYGGIGALFLCSSSAIGLARVTDANHPTARAVISFLDGTAEWQTIGTAPVADRNLSKVTGFIAQARTADDKDVSVLWAKAGQELVPVSLSGLAFSEKIQAGSTQFALNGLGAAVSQSRMLPAGGSRAVLVKTGPMIARVQPAAGPVKPLAVAPGMAVEIYGSELQAGKLTLTDGAGVVHDIEVTYSSASQLNAVLPAGISGLVKLTIKNTSGSHTVNVLTVPVLPVLFRSGEFAAAVNAVTGSLITTQNPAARGDIISLFLTGLGTGQPAVEIGGKPCQVLYAGPSGGYRGLDQVNCVVPAGVGPGKMSLMLRAGGRTTAAVLVVR